MNAVTHINTSPPLDDATLFAHRRTAIDMIATTRARAIRVALFGAYLFRSHPTKAEDEATRQHWRDVLREQCDDLSRSCRLLHGTDPRGEVPAPVCNWLAEYAANHPKHCAGLERMRDLSVDVLRAAENADEAALDGALHAHLVYGRGGFFELVTEFIDGLWSSLDAERQDDVGKATASANAISKTLQRLEHIGKHVRLVSLNASVEAARVGDAGRGLGVIAVEFKTLAEEIQHLATTARADISALGLSSDNTAHHTRSGR